MYVVATAGHVDHGKSTLVRALTGQDPDRLEEERRRGLSIELGYCWTTLPGAGEVAFVDVPGHERFLTTMLAGVGPVPAVLFVVAADDDWMPQAAEHLAALAALGVRHGVVAVTRSDLADPGPATERARRELAATPLRDAPVVTVSGRTGAGLDELRGALSRMLIALPTPSPDAPVRLWVDRCFTVAGAGTVVTGTLPEGTIRVGDQLAARSGAAVRVRGIESLGRPREQLHGCARVALRLGGGVPAGLGRGAVLYESDGWQLSDTADVRVASRDAREAELPTRPLLHVGSASMSVRSRPLGRDVHRLRLDYPLPLHVGDRLVLRDPGSRSLWGGVVLDPAPPPLVRRGDARRRADALAEFPGRPDLADELRRRVAVRDDLLRRLGVPVDEATVQERARRAGGWLLDRRATPALERRLASLLREHAGTHPLESGLSLSSAARLLGLPSADLVPTVVRDPLEVVDGRVVDRRTALPEPLLRAVAELRTTDLAGRPFAAPGADRLTELGLDQKALAAAAKDGLLLRLSDAVVLMPGADELAVQRLRTLPQPFTASEARVCLETSRRVVVPLLELLDSRRLTRRLPDDRRVVV